MAEGFWGVHGALSPKVRQFPNRVVKITCDTINQIVAEVETFKKSALPPLEAALLTQVQERFVTTQKKEGFCLNGKDRVSVQTLHGAFEFAKQRLVRADGTDSDFLEATQQTSVSGGLQEYGLYYLNRMSFEEVEGLVERTSGARLACAQTLWNGALQKALVLDAGLAKEVAACQDMPFPKIATSVDIYSPEAEEVLVLTDAIGVKAQKPTRQKPGELPIPKQAKRHDTDVLLLETPGGGVVYLAGSTDERVSLVEVADARLRREWGERKTPLPVVAITDGARSIRLNLTALLGEGVRIILD